MAVVFAITREMKPKGPIVGEEVNPETSTSSINSFQEQQLD